MVLYQVTLAGGGVVVTRQEETLEGVITEEIADPILFKKAVEFALREPSVQPGVRLLREGQVRVLESHRSAGQIPDLQAEQARWEQACHHALTAQEVPEEGGAAVVDLFAKVHHRQQHELLD